MTCQQRPEICVLLRRGAKRKSFGVVGVTAFMLFLMLANMHVTQINWHHYFQYDGQSQNFSRFLNPLSWRTPMCQRNAVERSDNKIITNDEASEQQHDSHFQDGDVSHKSIELQGTQQHNNTSQLKDQVDDEKLMVMMPRRAVIKHPGLYSKDELQKVNWVSNKSK